MVLLFIRYYFIQKRLIKETEKEVSFQFLLFSVKIYTYGIHFINQVEAFAYWYGNVEYKDDVPDAFNFKYIYNKVYQ